MRRCIRVFGGGGFVAISESTSDGATGFASRGLWGAARFGALTSIIALALPFTSASAVLICLQSDALAGGPETAIIGRHGGPGIPQAYATGEPVREASSFGVNLEAWAALPLGVGGGLTIEGPAGFRAGFGVGATPGAFIDLGIAAVGQPGSYSAQAALTVRDRLETPLFMRVTFAIAPPSWGGFYLGIGYGFYRGAATVDAGDIDRGLWPAIAGLNAETTASLTVVSHHVTADIGWEFDLGHNFGLRATLGGVFTFAAHSQLRVTGLTKVVSVQEQTASINAAESAISEAIVDYGKLPSLTIALTYRLF